MALIIRIILKRADSALILEQSEAMTTINLNCSFTHINSLTPHNLLMEWFYSLFYMVEETEAQRGEVMPLKSCLSVRCRTWTLVLNSRAAEEPPAGATQSQLSQITVLQRQEDYWRWLLSLSHSASLCFIRINNWASISCLHVPMFLFKDGLQNKKKINCNDTFTN